MDKFWISKVIHCRHPHANIFIVFFLWWRNLSLLMAPKKKSPRSRDGIFLRAPKTLIERIDKLVEQSDLDRTAYIVELLKDAIDQDLILKEEKVIRRITKPRELVFDEPNETFEEIWTYAIPLVGAVAAGKPITATIEEELRVAQDYPGDHVAYRVCGDSMTLPNGTGILDGSTIVVRHFDVKARTFQKLKERKSMNESKKIDPQWGERISGGADAPKSRWTKNQKDANGKDDAHE